MAKTKIQKTLLVGLGGTGNLALKYAKKRFHEMYGKGESFDEFNLPLIEYLAFDTDLGDLKKGVDNTSGYLKDSEYHHLKVSKPSQVLKSTPYIEKEWMPKRNIEVLTAIEAGAGQIRAFGRFGLMNQYNQVKDLIQDKVERLNSWRQGQNDDYEAMGDGVNIVYCFSIAGGTGSGTFLDMAYLVKDCLSKTSVDFKSQAYIVLPEIFDKAIDKAMGKKRIWANSYGALRELEFFMEGKYQKDIELLDNNQMTIPVEGAPYDLVHLISDKTSNGTDYDQISHIMELVGSNIVLKSGELNSKSNSAWDNIGKDLSMLGYLDNARTQKPRYLGLGYAEIRYNTNIVSDFVSAKLSSALSDLIIDSNNRENELTLEQRVLDWGIKEDEADHVIDQILPSNSYASFVLDGDGYDGSNSRSNLESNAEAHLSSQIQNLRKKAAANLQDFQNRVVNNILDDFINIDGSILDKGGVTTTIDAIDKLLAQPFIERYAFQMDDEIESNYSGSGKGLKEQIKMIQNRIKQELQDLSKAQDSNWLLRKSNCVPIIGSLVSSYNKLIQYNAEQIKRENAKQFYATLSTELVKLKDKLSNFKSKIEKCQNDFYNTSKGIENSIGRQSLKPFVIDLHKNKISHSNHSSFDSIKLSLFLDKTQTKLSSFIDIDVDEIKKEVGAYVNGTSIIEEINNDNLSFYLAELAKKNKSDVVSYFKNIKNMSQPLLSLVKDKFSLDMGDDWTESMLWGVGSINNSVYELIDSDVDPGADIMTTNDHSFLMASTLHYPAPIFALTNMQRYYDEYMDHRSAASCDTDKRIRQAMDEAKFHLIPKDVAREKTIFAWIFGLILNKLTDGEEGIYRKGTGKFFLKTKEASIADKHWLDLGSPWRTVAFEKFREDNFEGEMLQKIKKHLENIGGDQVQELIQEIKDDFSTTYISKYSELNRSWEDLKASKDSRDKEVVELMNLELNFIHSLKVESLADFL